MTRFIPHVILSAIACLFVLTTMPVSAKAEEFTEAQKSELKKFMDDYLMENGETVLKSVNAYQAKIEEQDRAEASGRATDFLEKVKNDKTLPMAGNPDGDVTMVEFFDFNCGYCRKALEDIQVVLKDDKDLKIIFIDMPILGPQSLEASKWALAAHKQGKYFEFHTAVLEHNGEKSESALEKIAEKVGLDVKKLKKDKADEGIANTLESNMQSAQAIGIRGTPGFILDGELFPGYLPADEIKKSIKAAREKK